MKRNSKTNPALSEARQRRSFSKDLWPAHQDFIEAVQSLQHCWKYPGRVGNADRYQRRAWDNLIEVASRLPLRGTSP